MDTVKNIFTSLQGWLFTGKDFVLNTSKDSDWTTTSERELQSLMVLEKKEFCEYVVAVSGMI